MNRFCLATPAFFASALAASALGLMLDATPARADVIVYTQAPPPPPPPPPDYYGQPPPPPRYYYRRRAYYEEREPPYQLELGFDLEGAVPVNLPRFLDGNDVEGGGGFKVRLGEQVHLQGGLGFTIEGGYAFDHLFASDDAGDVAYSWDMHRFFGGVRLAFGHVLVPVIYAHVGYGWRDTGDPTVPEAGGLAFDVGGALDLRIIPHLGLGAHVEYATIDAEPYAPQWVAFGLHADLYF
jgi:hypothetical protein